MAQAKDGGPAFPIRLGCDVPGMSLRDWFAGMHQLPHEVIVGIIKSSKAKPDEAIHLMAQMQYAFADAMLKAREE